MFRGSKVHLCDDSETCQLSYASKYLSCIPAHCASSAPIRAFFNCGCSHTLLNRVPGELAFTGSSGSTLASRDGDFVHKTSVI